MSSLKEKLLVNNSHSLQMTQLNNNNNNNYNYYNNNNNINKYCTPIVINLTCSLDNSMSTSFRLTSNTH